VTYDINTNTNYNPDVEASSPVSGPRRIAQFLGGLLVSASSSGDAGRASARPALSEVGA
jgi:hypothetical protein